MAVITIYHKPEIVKNIDRQAGAIRNSREWNSYSLTSGNEADIYLNWIPWITLVNAYSLGVTTTGTAAYTAFFRYSTDGGNTWSAEAVIASITGLSLTNERTHFRLIIRRSGTGMVTIDTFSFSVSLNSANPAPSPELWPISIATTPGATGYTYDWNKNPTARIKEILEGMAEGVPGTFATPARRYAFHWGRPDSCKADYSKPTIFAFDCRTIVETSRTRQTNLIQFRMGVKRTAQSVRHPGEEGIFGQFQTQIGMIFGPASHRFRWDAILINSCWFYGITLNDLGIKSCRVFGSAFRYEDSSLKDSCGAPESWECVVEFTTMPHALWSNFTNL